MSDGQTPRAAGDAAWSEQHAETGGWPPPTPDQRRYEPGLPPTGPDGPTATDGPGGRISGSDGLSSGPSGYGPGPGAYGPGPDAYGTGPAAYSRGTDRDPATPAPWAPGDSAYGRLAGPDPTPPATPRRAPVRRPRSAVDTPVTLGLIVLCVLIHLAQQVDPTLTYRFGLLPVAVTDGGEWYRLITAAFLHAGLLHLATNMLTLYIVGAPLERVLRPTRYLTVYLLSALGGSLLSLWLSPAYTVGVGASGAIFGLFGALVVLRRQVGAEASGLFVLIGLNLVISFTIPNISWQAHVGGLVTGTLVALALLPTLRAQRR